MPEKEDVELALGFLFMAGSWITVFLIVIGLLDFPSEIKIAFLLFLYALSVTGLLLSSHSVMVKLVLKKRKELEKH